MPGTVTIKPLQAKLDVKDEHLMTKLDPYCVAIVSDHFVEGQVCKKGGSTPIWEDSLSISVGNEPYCYLEVKDKRLLRDRMLGVCAIDLDELNTQGKSRRWYELYNKQLPVGEILVEVEITGETERDKEMIHQKTREEYSGLESKGDYSQELRPPQKVHMTPLSMELEEMNKKIDFMINRTKELEVKAKGIEEPGYGVRTSYGELAGREGVAYVPEESRTEASHRRFSDDLDLSKREQLKEGYRKGKEMIKEGFQSLSGQRREEEAIKANYPYPVEFSERTTQYERKDLEKENLREEERSGVSKDLKTKVLEGVEKLAHTSIEKLQHVEDWAERKMEKGGALKEKQGFLPYESTQPSYELRRGTLREKEVQTDISFHPYRELSWPNITYLLSQRNEEEFHKANLGLLVRTAVEEIGYSSGSTSEEEGERIRKTESNERKEKKERRKLRKRELKQGKSEEKVEYETGQYPQESIYKLGKDIGNKPSEQGLKEEKQGFLGTIKSKVKEGIEQVKHILPEHEEKSKRATEPAPSKPKLLESAKEKIEEGVNWVKSIGKGHGKDDVEIKEETLGTTPSKSEQIPARPSASNLLVSPSIERREGRDIISIPIVTDKNSPGGGEAFEELKRRYIPTEITMANEARFSQVMNELNSLPMSFLFENQYMEQGPRERLMEELAIQEEALEREEEQEMMEKLEVLGEVVQAVEEMGLLEEQGKKDEEIVEEVIENLEALGAIAEAAGGIDLLEAVEEVQVLERERELENKMEALADMANRIQEDLLEGDEEAIVKDYKVEVDIEEAANAEIVTMKEEYDILRPVENLMDQEGGNNMEDVKVYVTGTIATVEVGEENEENKENLRPSEFTSIFNNVVGESLL